MANYLSTDFIRVEKELYKVNNIEVLSMRMLLNTAEVINELKYLGVIISSSGFLKPHEFDKFLTVYGKRIFTLMNSNKLDNSKIDTSSVSAVGFPKKNKLANGNGKKIQRTSKKRESVYDKISNAKSIGKIIYIRAK